MQTRRRICDLKYPKHGVASVDIGGEEYLIIISKT